MALVGENGVGKSTVLQCAASVYRPIKGRGRFASDFFPDTAWETIQNAQVKYSARQGNDAVLSTIRKPGERWRGNPDRPERAVEYIDLTRIQPVPARIGYSRMAKSNFKEISSDPFDASRLARFSQVMGRAYEFVKMSLTDADATRQVPVLGQRGSIYSGFHQGAGETTIAELLEADLPQGGMVLIDEIESSLHPRAQRRLIRDLAAICRQREFQVILTTHSPYVLDELPLEARAYIMATPTGRNIVYGVSPEFAMTKMDDVQYSECDLYVEDNRAKALVTEILAAKAEQVVQRCRITSYGAASVGQALGIMQSQRRFDRPTCVFLDGDQASATGCIILPGEDAPERVVFNALKSTNWTNLAERTGRDFADIADACNRAMTLQDHHEWVKTAANELTLGSDILWQAMCAEWARKSLADVEAKPIVQAVEDALNGVVPDPIQPLSALPPIPSPVKPKNPSRSTPSSNEQPQLL